MNQQEWSLRTASGYRQARNHASSRDFCAIFGKEMASLYGLALFLTANHDQATQVFMEALNDCLRAEAVLHQQARSWSHRAVIKSALRVTRPTPEGAAAGEAGAGVLEQIGYAVRPLMRLRAFDRFVFAMVVLERYSVAESALLLGCSRADVQGGRERALRMLADDRDLMRGRFGRAVA